MRIKCKRLISIVLCVTMGISLIPALPVSATTGDIIHPENFADEAKFIAFADAQEDSATMVMRYFAPGSDGNPTGVARIDFGFYKISATSVAEFNLHYNTEDVAIQYFSGGTNVGDLPAENAQTAKMNTYIPKVYPTGSVDSTIASHFFYKNSDAGFGTALNKSALTISPLASIGITSGEFNGIYKVAVEPDGILVTGISSEKLSKLYESHAGKNLFSTKQIDSVVYTNSVYFSEKTSGSIDSTTFATVVDSYNSPNGVLAMVDAVILTQRAAFIGFPQPAAVTVSVPFKVIATEGATTTFLTSPAVKISKADGTNVQNFVGGAEGILLNASDSSVVTDSTLKLEVGNYKYTVTPTETELYSPYDGTFSVAEGTASLVYLHAQPKNSGEKAAYTFNLLDGESAADDMPLADAEVAVNGVATTNTNGLISFNVVPNATYPIGITKTGYKTQSGTVTVGAAGVITSMTGPTFANGAVVLDQTRTAVTVEAKAGGAALKDAIITVSANPAAGKTVTANMAANELPMLAKADAAGKATFKLPDGDYLYTINAAGFEETVKSLAIAPTTVTVAEADGTGTPAVTQKGTADAAGDFKVALDPTAPAAITDPLYYVTGTWDNAENPTKMTVEVYLKNAKAHNGTFGLKFDPLVFSLASNGFVKSEAIADPIAYAVDGASGKVANPVSGTGYHAFVWSSKNDGTPVDGTQDAKLLATYTLDLTTAAQNGGYKTMMNSKSLAVAPYTKTAASKLILDAYAEDDAKPTQEEIAKRDAFIVKHWRLTDVDNEGTPTLPRLPAKFATEGGFQQINVDKEPSVQVTDIRAQFVFENFGVPAVTFLVNATPDSQVVGAPIADALVTIKKGGTTVKTAKTDEFGGVIMGLPANDTYTYTISKIGFQTKADVALTVVTADQSIAVLMPADESHKAMIAESQKNQITLLGADRAPNSVPYTFNLQPKAGYMWATTIPNGPLPADITVTLGKTQIASTDITWDANKNHYVLAGTNIKGDATADLTFMVSTDKIIEKPVDSSPKISVSATGTGAGFTITPVVSGNSTFNPADIVGNKTAVVETLGAGKTTSATYAFKEGGPTIGGSAPTTGKYEAYVISQVLVNGVQLTITDTQRVHGFANQLINVSDNQMMTAIYGKATVNADDPENPIEDGDGNGGGVETPDADATVSLIIGKGGSAEATIDTTPQAKITGYDRADYKVTKDKAFSMVITAGTVTQPNGASVAYEIDQVLVDGTNVITTKAGTWDNATRKLDLGTLAAGAKHTVVVTFKVVGEASNQAVLQTVHMEGNGDITPLGTSVYTVGDSPVVDFVPETHWKVGDLSLTAPETTKVDVTKDIVGNTYKVPALKAGITTLEYAFDEQAFKVQLSLDYGSIRPKKKGFDVVFVRAASAGVEAKKITAVVDIPAGAIGNVLVEVPAGTWTVVVSKDGYLSYSVSEFTITPEGTAVGAYVNSGIIYFGKANENATTKAIKPILGDATRDKTLIALDDAAQVANGMTVGASEERKNRADLDENGTPGVEDMAFVTANFGKRATKLTYANFVK